MRKGVHDPAKFRGLDDSAIGLLTSLEGGRTLVTLAPEMATPELIAKLAACGRGGVRGTHECRLRGDSRGIATWTQRLHSPVQCDVATRGTRARRRRRGARGPGELVRHHRRWTARRSGGAAYRVALQAHRSLHAGDRCDAQRRHLRNSFMLQGRRISVDGNACVDEDGRSPAHTWTWPAVRNAVSMLGLSLLEAVRMASRYPAEFLGIGTTSAGSRPAIGPIWFLRTTG